MPIKLSNPIQIVVNDIGDNFVVESVKFDFQQNKAEFFWRIKTQERKVLKQGTEILSGDNFTEFYNTRYITHADLVNKVAELAGYSGEFRQENLI